MFDLSISPTVEVDGVSPEDAEGVKYVATSLYDAMLVMAEYVRSAGDSFDLRVSFDQKEKKLKVLIETGIYAPMGHFGCEWSAGNFAEMAKRMDEFPEGMDEEEGEEGA